MSPFESLWKQNASGPIKRIIKNRITYVYFPENTSRQLIIFTVQGYEELGNMGTWGTPGHAHHSPPPR